MCPKQKFQFSLIYQVIEEIYLFNVRSLCSVSCKGINIVVDKGSYTDGSKGKVGSKLSLLVFSHSHLFTNSGILGN